MDLPILRSLFSSRPAALARTQAGHHAAKGFPRVLVSRIPSGPLLQNGGSPLLPLLILLLLHLKLSRRFGRFGKHGSHRIVGRKYRQRHGAYAVLFS